MAKIAMLCPFSHELCKECAYYRGRHYYLCFSKEYRGYIGKSKESIKEGFSGRRSPESKRKGIASKC